MGETVAGRHGYSVRLLPVGPEDAERRTADADGGVHPMRIDLPDPSLVVLIGAVRLGQELIRAPGTSRPTEVISSDFCRGLVADDENDQSATADAFAVLHFIAARRLAQPRFTVVDATNVQRAARKPLIQLAREHDLFPVAIVLDVPEAVCQERNRSRPDRDFGPHVVRQQTLAAAQVAEGAAARGVPPSVGAAIASRRSTPRRSGARRCGPTAAAEHGPFDIIGDVHGCHAELVELLGELGYEVDGDGLTVTPPEGRRAVFVGDYGDRGPGHAGGAEARDGDGRRRDGDLPARQPRHQARAQAQGTRRADHPRPRRDARAARARARGVPRSRRASSSTGSSATSCSTTASSSSRTPA